LISNSTKNRKYHTVGTVPKYHIVGTILKYHTVGTILKSNRNDNALSIIIMIIIIIIIIIICNKIKTYCYGLFELR